MEIEELRERYERERKLRIEMSRRKTESLKKEGFIRVALWIPPENREEFHTMAMTLREEHRRKVKFSQF